MFNYKMDRTCLHQKLQPGGIRLSMVAGALEIDLRRTEGRAAAIEFGVDPEYPSHQERFRGTGLMDREESG